MLTLSTGGPMGGIGVQLGTMPAPALIWARRTVHAAAGLMLLGSAALVLLWRSQAQMDPEVVLPAAGIMASVAAICLLLTLRTPRTRSRWSVRARFADQRVRMLFEAFVIVQLMDVATSIVGRHLLLGEGAALTRAAVDSWGNWGFLAIKVPALLATCLAVARLPRRFAAPVLTVATAIMLVVVVDNLQLILRTGS